VPENGDLVTFAQLRTAAAVDPVAFRAFWQVLGMIRPPGLVYNDSRIVAATRTALADPLAAPQMTQPSRAKLVAALTARR
jgi:hypothetical protein